MNQLSLTKDITVENSIIKDLVAKNGYATVNVQDTYYYTVGFGEQGKNDLFGLCHYPFGMFQVIASKYASEEVLHNKPFWVHEYKLPCSALEPSRCKLVPLKLQTNNLIQTTLARPAEGFNTQGFSLVVGPDLNNQLLGEAECSLKFEPNELIQLFISGANEDLTRAVNEANKLREQLGIK